MRARHGFIWSLKKQDVGRAIRLASLLRGMRHYRAKVWKAARARIA